MPSSHNDEKELVEAARSGDHEAFEILVRRYMPRSLAYVRQMVGNAEDAEDIVQDGFVKAYRGLENFKGESSFYTWFFRILSNLCLDHLRKGHFLKKLFFFPDDSSREDDEPGPLERAPDEDPGSLPDFRLGNKELGAALEKALKSLPARQKSVFLLKNNEGLKIIEIAAMLQISEGAVKSHLVRAVTALRKSMKGYHVA